MPEPHSSSLTHFTGTGAVRPRHAIDGARLTLWLEAHIADFSGPLTIEQFNGGQSNPTYKLRTPSRDYVLRRKPPGEIVHGAHAIEREYRLISALFPAGLPVARPYGLCEDPGVLGTPFYVMEMVEGRVFWDSTFATVPCEQRSDYFDAMNATIARLHACNPAAMGLGDYGRPGNYFERQIARWTRQYRADEAAGSFYEMDRLADWLPNNIPAGEETAIIHGDFRADNLVFHPDRPEVLAILDWELSTVGHPLADFSYHMMMYHFPPSVLGGFAGVDLQANGIPTEKEYIAAYCARSGRDRIDHLDFYLAFNMFRFAAIVHGIKARMIRGTAASGHADALVRHLPRIAALAAERATRSGVRK